MTRKKKKNIKNKIFGVVDNSVGNYDNDPFFVKKANDAREFLKKVGLPKNLTKEQLGL